MKMFLISDNIDTYTGMRLVGVEGVVVHEREELKKALEEAIANKENGVILLTEKFGKTCELFRAAPRIIDVHAKGVSKAKSARALQRQLGKKILVCAVDAENDILMMQDADYAFCPADSYLTSRFPAVCPCGEGAVADVIYEKIPEILKKA